MLYKDFKGKRISQLAFGCMRLPCICGDDSKPDPEKTKELVKYAMEHGINYYDTAWGYHAGNSETVIGEALSAYPRDSFYLADKFPGYDVSNMPKAEEIFEQQLKKCRTDYFDFYLIHNVCELNIRQYLDPQFGIKDYFVKQVKNGRIKHLGFSVHGEMDCLNAFLEVYGDAMEFCQIQINYFDWNFQHAKEKVERVSELGIPVWVMEPLRGGKLANIDGEHMAELERFRPGVSAVEWAFRFLQSIPEVTTTLTGMSDFEQQKVKIDCYGEEKPLTGKEFETIVRIGDEMAASGTVPCTSCRYCVTHCQKNLDIPLLIARYNQHLVTEVDFITPMAMGGTPKEQWPDACVGCRKCEKVCPQQIKISEIMKKFSKILEEGSPF
ncbi:putative oxidoreductases of the aldo/keto reductase family [Thermoplasmatales archaeon BRNA1]|nr:putative oxidoreductases of the aldo/keto reductase family [Thermoplasmatales archaeon BRNA1]